MKTRKRKPKHDHAFCTSCERAAALPKRKRKPLTTAQRKAQWHAANREHRLAYNREWHAANREHRLAYNRLWRAANREHTRAYDRARRPASKEVSL